MNYTVQHDPFDGQPTGLRRDDGACIPLDPENADYRAFLIWNAAQATPLAVTAQSPVPATPNELLESAADGRALAALAFRASASWTSATSRQQAAAQAIIDGIGAKVLAILPR